MCRSVPFASATALVAGDATFGPVAEPVDLVPLPVVGRRFLAGRRVRLGDTTPRGRLRLDAVARYLQDVADDDAVDAGLDPDLAWVVRRTIVEVLRFPVLRERLEIITVCTGMGPRWAERRTSLRGEHGSRVEAAALWVLLDGRSGRPVRLPERVASVYAPSSGGRTVSARLLHPDPDPERLGPARSFPLRATDLDIAGHVNNAVYWALLEEFLRGTGRDQPLRAEVEHRRALEGDVDPVILVEESPAAGPGGLGTGGVSLWARGPGPEGPAAAQGTVVATSARAALLSGSTA